MYFWSQSFSNVDGAKWFKIYLQQLLQVVLHLHILLESILQYDNYSIYQNPNHEQKLLLNC